ncbi:unnamed protein product [Schistocephalus solidus]|uniref:HECT domain-containing protein n=1 Tax=Schistocephalus solidus TaxID=70667 RepID=A0A183SEY3_SCHSO|nr:unnamed protein product [Schistocephalus solidus]
MFAWGSADEGQLGIDVSTEDNGLVSQPRWVPPLPESKVTKVACGYKHTLLLTSEGFVYSCGSNDFGQLGYERKTNSFTRISGLQHKIRDINCGAYHSGAITQNGKVYMWGCNTNGQLGRTSEDTSVALLNFPHGTVVQISLGVEHSVALTESSDVYVWGSNAHGQLGLGFVSQASVTTPTRIDCLGGLPVRQLVAGGYHNLLLTPSGSIYVWGSDSHGQLGLSDGHERMEVDEMPAGTSRRVSCSSCASAGYAASAPHISVPTLIKSMRKLRVTYVACGESHSVLLTQSGGECSYGCLYLVPNSHMWPSEVGFFPAATPRATVTTGGLNQVRASGAVCASAPGMFDSRTSHSLEKSYGGGDSNPAEEIQGYADRNEMKNFLRAIKAIFGPFTKGSAALLSSGGTKPVTEKSQIRKCWAEHFRSVLNCSSAISNAAINRLPQVDTYSDLDLPPSISAEMWRKGQVPQDFKDATFVHLLKRKGNRQLCDNHRGILLLNMSGKIFARILLNRLNGHLRQGLLPNSLCGFRRHCETIDMVFAACQIQEKFGQLGHGDNKQSGPKLVSSLSGRKVLQVACGCNHTLVTVHSNGNQDAPSAMSTPELFAFGAGSEGQLGIGDLHRRLQPTIISCNWTNKGSNDSNGFVITELFAGGHHCFALVSKRTTDPPASTLDYRVWRPCHLSNIATLNQPLLECYEQGLPEHPFLSSLRKPSLAFETQSTYGDKVYCLNAYTSETAFNRIEAAFRSVGSLASSFLVDNSSRSHYDIGRKEHGVDLDAAQQLQKTLFLRAPPTDTRKIIKCLMDTVLSHPLKNYPDLECLRALLVLSVSPLLETPRKPVAIPASSALTEPTAQVNFLDGEPINWYPAVLAGFTSPGLILGFFCMAVNRLDPVPSGVMGPELVHIKHGGETIATPPVGASVLTPRKLIINAMHSALELMKRLYTLNESMKDPISYTSFYIPELNNDFDAERFLNWLKQRNSMSKDFSIFDYPFIFDGAAKAKMLTLEARLTMLMAVKQAQFESLGAFAAIFSDAFKPVLLFQVSRTDLVPRTLQCLASCSPADLKRPLKVEFDGEEAVDDGGVLKEFFLLIMREILNPIFGMFKFYPESRMLWFSEAVVNALVAASNWYPTLTYGSSKSGSSQRSHPGQPSRPAG